MPKGVPKIKAQNTQDSSKERERKPFPPLKNPYDINYSKKIKKNDILMGTVLR
jgi:hypothetical protein